MALLARVGVAAVGMHAGVHQRTFNVARPISTSTTAMIQKRTITRGSGQPLSSKWWWIGAIRNTRRPVSLDRSEEHTSELQSLMRISYAVFCLKKTTYTRKQKITSQHK